MLDILFVSLYFVTLLIIAFINKRPGQRFKHFSKITENLSNKKIILIATIFASSIGGGTTFGIAEKAFAEDISHSYALILAIPIDILIAIYIVPKLIKYRDSLTVADIIYNFYGSPGRYIAGLSSILVSTGLLAAQISVSGRIFEYILKIDYIAGVVVSYGIIVIYTTIGGLQSIMFTNLLQFFAIIIAIPLVTIFGINDLGIDNFLKLLPMDKIDIATNSQLFYNTIYATLGFAVINLLPSFIQRAKLSIDTSKTKNAIYIKSIIYFIFLIIITINGLLTYINYPEVKASVALCHYIDQIIPIGFKGLIVIGLLSAVMSTADSDLNIISINIVNDFLKPLCNVENDKTKLLFARLANIFVGCLAIIIALYFTKVVNLVIFIAGFWGPVILIPLLFALYDIKISNQGFINSAIVGALSFMIWNIYLEESYGFKAVFIGTVSNLLVFLVYLAIQKKAKLIV